MAASFEITILENIRQVLDSPFMEKFMLAVSTSGDNGFVWIALAIGLIIFNRTRLAGIAVALALSLNFLLCNLLLKPWVGRLRPCDISDRVTEIIPCPTDFSFPSGHTSAAFAAAMTLWMFYPKWGLPILIFAGLMALSRLFLFVHFPSDVLFGMLLGSVCAWVCVTIIERRHTKSAQ